MVCFGWSCTTSGAESAKNKLANLFSCTSPSGKRLTIHYPMIKWRQKTHFKAEAIIPSHQLDPKMAAL